MNSPRNSAHLEDVDKISVKTEFQRQVDRSEIEVLDREAVKENVGGKHLFSADVDGILRQIEGISQSDVAGREFDLRRECPLGAGRQNNRPMSVDAQFEVREETCVVEKEADVGCASGRDVTGASLS